MPGVRGAGTERQVERRVVARLLRALQSVGKDWGLYSKRPGKA